MSAVDFPVMSAERLDYTDGEYKTRVQPSRDGGALEVHHQVSGDNLVTQLLRQSKAAFAAEIAAPYSTYRRIDVEQNGDYEKSVRVRQAIDWPNEAVVPPVHIRPLIIAKEREELTLGPDDGVHMLWQGVNVKLHPGSIIAEGPFWRAASTLESLLRVAKDKHGRLKEGSYCVKADTSDGFHFKVIMHPSLFDSISAVRFRSEARTILTGALAQGLNILCNDHKDDWSQFPVLRSLYKMIEDEGLATWDMQDEFHADEAATRLKPIELNLKEMNDEE